MDWKTELVITGLGLLWAVFKTSAWYREHVAIKYDTAVDAVEVGVAKTYNEYVRATKAASADGSLTDGEKAAARLRARQIAIEYGKAHGVDVLRELGEQFVDGWIEMKVREAKT